MFLAGVLAEAGGETALVCDLAETYHLLEYRACPATLAAALAAGLPAWSRTMTRLSGAACPLPLLLEAAAVDYLALLTWMHTKDGSKGQNRPASLAAALAHSGQEPVSSANAPRVYDSPEAFWAEREQLLKEGRRSG